MKTSIYIYILLMLSTFVGAQNNLYLGIDDISISQPNAQQLKVNLKVTGATYGEYFSYKTLLNQNEIILSVCYNMTGAGVITHFENDFYLDIPNTPNNYNLITNVYYSDAQTCNYINLDDTATLNFTTPIEGTVSLTTNDTNGKNEKLTLYPNPVKDVLNISSISKIDQINIYDISGKQIYKISSPKENKIDVSKLKTGIYYLEAASATKKWRERFLKQK